MKIYILYFLFSIGVCGVAFGLWCLRDNTKKIKSILSGWKHYLFTEPKIERMAQRRAEFCRHCQYNKLSTIDIITDKKIPELSGRHCGECMCPLSTKLRSKFEECPLTPPLWVSE